MYSVSYNSDEHFVYVVTTGHYSIKDTGKFLRDGVKLADKNNCTKLIMDHRDCEFTASYLEINSIAKYLNSLGFGYKYTGAVIYNQDHEKYDFADTVSQNWSSGVLRFFDDIEEAKKWLLS
ncbi:MAG: hypothetical protein CL663_04375 [Bacteroidetes bacterium]|nr:hypothetical protein [Bacteroidota bacterium]